MRQVNTKQNPPKINSTPAVSIVREKLSVKLGLPPKDVSDPFLRNAQKKYDANYFDKEFPLERLPRSRRDAKIEHIAKHLVASSFSLFSYLRLPDERHASVAQNHIIGTIAMHRTQIANTVSCNLHKALGEMQITSDDPQLAYDYLQDAVQVTNEFGMKLEKEFPRTTDRSRVRDVSIPSLHISSVILSNHFQTDSTLAHMKRLIV